MAKTPNQHTLLARAILKAVAAREDSWNDHEGGYGITLWEACRRATSNKDRAELVNLLLSACWNDAQNWAEEYLRRE